MSKFTGHSVVNHYFVSEIQQPLSYFSSIWQVAGANIPSGKPIQFIVESHSRLSVFDDLE